MSFAHPAVGDVKLEKDPPLSYVARPGSPGDPGSPDVPAYDTFETRTIPIDPPADGFGWYLDAAGNPVQLPLVYGQGWYSELGEYKNFTRTDNLAPGSTYTALVHHDAVPGRPAIPETPAVIAQLNNTGWNSIGVLDDYHLDTQQGGYIISEGAASFIADPNIVGAAVGLIGVIEGTDPFSIPHAFYLQRGRLRVMEKGVLVFDDGSMTYTETDVLTIRLHNKGLPSETAQEMTPIDYGFPVLGRPRPHVIEYYKNNSLIYTSENPADGVLVLIALFFAPGDRIKNAAYEQGNSIYGGGLQLAPLGERRRPQLTPLRMRHPGVSRARLPALFGYGADRIITYSNGQLTPLRGRGYGTPPGTASAAILQPPAVTVSNGKLATLKVTARGIVERHANGAGVIVPMFVRAADRAGYSYSEGTLMALRVRPTLPFVRVLLGGTLGGTSNLTGAVRIIGYVDATGALTTVFTVRVGTLVTLTSQLGIRGDWNVSKAIYELLSNYLGISGKGPQLDNAEDLFETWVVNMDTKASTRYEQFDFNSFAFVDGHYFGAQQDGVYLLEGDDDHGDPIRASINFGLQNFGTSLMKHVPDVYVGVASDGRLVLKVKSDAETYFYTQRDASEFTRTQRFDLGRGLRNSFFEFELFNQDGGDFDMESIEFVVVTMSRRV
jgi:hypothetical protein